MPIQRLTLTAKDPDELPLAFSVGDRLAGRDEAFRDQDGKRVAGKLLRARLEAFGVGVKTVSVEGRYRPYGSAPGTLLKWSASRTLAGTVDPYTLGAVVHAMARQFSETRPTHHDGTPPEIYVTLIEVSTVLPDVKRQRLKDGRTIYRDKKTGRFASKDGWRASVRSRKRK